MTATVRSTPRRAVRTLSYNRLVGVLTICQGREEDSYYLDPLKHDLGPLVRCFSLTKLPATRKPDSPDEYAVSIDLATRAGSCECLGHLRHGHRTVCRHVAALLTLADRGSI